MVCSHSLVGVAPGEAAQSRGDGVGSGSKSAQALQTAIKTRVVSTGRRGGPSWTTHAFGETLERRLWAIQREDRRLAGAQSSFIRRSLSTTVDWGDRRSPASTCSCLRRCDPCVPVCAPLAQGQIYVRRTRRCSSTAPDNEHATPRLTAVPRAVADGACRLAHGRARSGSAARRRKRCSRCR